jgi:hypothetical protein
MPETATGHSHVPDAQVHVVVVLDALPLHVGRFTVPGHCAPSSLHVPPVPT